MKTRYSVGAWLGLSVVGAFVLSGCGGAGSKPEVSRTEVGSTPSAAPAPGSENSAVAPTRTPPEGFGNAIGRVLYNDAGASGIEVELCQRLDYTGGCDGNTYGATTDEQGFYVIDKVEPGRYSIAVRMFNSDRYAYPRTGIATKTKFEIEKNETLSVRSLNIWKMDLQVESPKKGAVVKEAKPIFRWKAYPGAEIYEIQLDSLGSSRVPLNIKAGETSAIPARPLYNGKYKWNITAYNAQKVRLAETSERIEFEVTGQAASSEIELVNPKHQANIAGKNLVLQWKGHPDADDYQVYLRGLKSRETILRYVSVDGTSYKLKEPLAPDVYYWNVNARKDGKKISSSKLQRFVVK